MRHVFLLAAMMCFQICHLQSAEEDSIIQLRLDSALQQKLGDSALSEYPSPDLPSWQPKGYGPSHLSAHGSHLMGDKMLLWAEGYTEHQAKGAKLYGPRKGIAYSHAGAH